MSNYRWSPRPTLQPSPSETPYASPTTVPTTTPEATSYPSSSPVNTDLPNATASAEPSSTREPEQAPRTDLSDGKSDGLGCSVKDCSGTQVAAQSAQVLPATGQADAAVITTVIALTIFLAGIYLVVNSYRQKK